MPSPFPGMDPYLEAPDLWPVCFQAIYSRACYDVSIDYSEPVPPPELDPEEQRLVASFVKR